MDKQKIRLKHGFAAISPIAFDWMELKSSSKSNIDETIQKGIKQLLNLS